MENLENHLNDLTYLSNGAMSAITDANALSLRDALYSVGVRNAATIVTEVGGLMCRSGMLRNTLLLEALGIE